MNFSGAFAALGYELKSPRIDWSAENKGGVCLSLWSKEIKWSPGEGAFDTTRDAQPIEQWNRKPGFKKRLQHLQRVMTELEGRVDVVLVSGKPGASYEDAHPWKPEVRKAEWVVDNFDPETGHFSVRTRPI